MYFKHTYICIDVNTYIHACVYVYTNTYICVYVHTYTHTSENMCVYACVHICVYGYIHARVYVFTNTYMCICPHIHIHKSGHVYVNTHAHMNTHMWVNVCRGNHIHASTQIQTCATACMGTQTQLYTLSHEINAIVFIFESICMFESSNVCRVKDTWFFLGTMINPEDIVAFLELETAKECETILGNPPELVPTTIFKVRLYSFEANSNKRTKNRRSKINNTQGFTERTSDRGWCCA